MGMMARLYDSRLIGDLYDTAVDPERWPLLLDRIAHRIGSKGSTILSLDPQETAFGHSIVKFSTMYKAEDVALYQAEYSHHERAFTRRLQPANLAISSLNRALVIILNGSEIALTFASCASDMAYFTV